MMLRKVLQGGALTVAAASLAFGAASLYACSSSDNAGGGGDASASGDGAQGDGGTAADTGTGEGGDAAAQVSCDSYCTLIMQTCTGANREYTDINTCKAMCAKLSIGDAGDMSGDTVACRQYHAGAAVSNPDFHCHHAGPTGGDVCGTSHCQAWCDLDIAQCGTKAYADTTSCVTACAGFPVLDGGDIATAGGMLITSGFSFNCRLYHLEAAYTDPNFHCPHTGVVSATCGSPPDGGAEAGADGSADAAGD